MTEIHADNNIKPRGKCTRCGEPGQWTVTGTIPLIGSVTVEVCAACVAWVDLPTWIRGTEMALHSELKKKGIDL